MSFDFFSGSFSSSVSSGASIIIRKKTRNCMSVGPIENFPCGGRFVVWYIRIQPFTVHFSPAGRYSPGPQSFFQQLVLLGRGPFRADSFQRANHQPQERAKNLVFHRPILLSQERAESSPALPYSKIISRSGRQYQAAPGPPGTPGRRRRRWRCGSSSPRSPASLPPPRCRRRR